MELIKRVSVEYLANAGFMLCGGGHRILIDAVFSRKHMLFSAMPPALLESILRAEEPFSDVDLVLFTHRHADHCNPKAVLGLRQADVRVIIPGDAYEERPEEAGQRFLYLEGESGTVWEDDALRITAIQSPHDRAGDVTPALHYSYLLEFKPEQVCVLVMGDAETGPHYFQEWLAGKRLSAMTVNFAEINQEKGRAFLREVAPELAILCHLPLPEDDQYHMAKLTQRRIDQRRQELPPCVLCSQSRTIYQIESK